MVCVNLSRTLIAYPSRLLDIFFKPHLCFAWRGFLLSFCVCPSVCVSVFKVSQKLLNRPTSFLVDGFPLTQRGNHSILKLRSMDLSALLDSCSWYDIGNFLQTCIKNSLLPTKSIEI